MATKKANSLYESKVLKKAVSDAVKGSHYQLKGSHTPKSAAVHDAKKIVIVKK